MTPGRRLRDLLEAGPLLAPGCWDAFTALAVEQAGFAVAYLSGASIAYTRLGRPDIGLTGLDDVVDVVGRITDRVDLPLIVDIDNGWGNALNVERAVRLIERAGAAAVQLEDQALPKRCGHLAGKRLIDPAEMVGKVRAARDARVLDTVIVARTDAIAVEGFEPALERAELYLEAGADVLFVEAPESIGQMTAIAARFGDRVPLLANMVEGGSTPLLPAAELHALGFRIVISPGGLARAFATLAKEYLHTLAADGSTAGFRDRMLDLGGLNEMLGTPELLAHGAEYEADEVAR